MLASAGPDQALGVGGQRLKGRPTPVREQGGWEEDTLAVRNSGVSSVPGVVGGQGQGSLGLG